MVKAASLHESAYLNPNLALHYVNKRAGEEEMITYHEPDGIIAYVRELNNGKEPVHEPVYFKGSVDQIEVEVAFQFVDAFEENILGFCTISSPRRAEPTWWDSRRNSPS